MKNAQITQQHNGRQQRTGSISEILLSLPVCVRIPVRINLWLQPGNMLLNSVTESVKLYFTPQELQSIEIIITRQHITVEAALVEYLKKAMRRYEKWQELIEQVRQRYGKDAYAMIDVELLGQITWNDPLRNVS